MEIVKRLEEGLFKTATTKEEYMNLETLENRLHVLIRGLPLSNQNQQYQQQGNTSIPMGTMLPNSGMPQSSGGQRNNLSLDPGFVKARQFLHERIYDFLMQQQKHEAPEIDPKKVMEIVKRLEEGLLRTATTKEEYMNLETLENRLYVLIRSLPLSNQNQQYQQPGNTFVPMGTMIPNSGMPQSGNSSIMVASSMDNSFVVGGGNSTVSSSVNTRNLLPNTT